MSSYFDLVGSWPELCDRLDSAASLQRWSHAEPTLRSVQNVAALRSLTSRGPLELRDAVLGAVVRCATASGGGDPHATLVVLHLLREGTVALARRLSDLVPEALDLTVGELTIQIQRFPVARRTRLFAMNLLFSTRAALLREWMPSRHELPYDAPGLTDLCDRTVGSTADGPDVEVDDLLRWARDRLVLTDDQVWLLRELKRGARLRVAAVVGVNERTIRRRHARAIEALRAAAPKYLGEVA